MPACAASSFSRWVEEKVIGSHDSDLRLMVSNGVKVRCHKTLLKAESFQASDSRVMVPLVCAPPAAWTRRKSA